MAKFDAQKEKSVIKLLDTATKKYGLRDVRHAANKWCIGQRDRLRLAKQSAALEKQLAEVNRRLRK